MKCAGFVLTTCSPEPPGRATRDEHMSCYDAVEVFGGVHSIVRGMRELGYSAAVYDIRMSDRHNVHSQEGLMELARMIAHVRPGSQHRGPGWLLIQPTCSTWTWVNSGTSLRKVDAKQYLLVVFEVFVVKGN